MPEFEAMVTVRSEHSVTITVKAASEEKAEEKVQAMIDAGDFALNAEISKKLEKLGAEVEETESDAEIDQVNEL
jgi:hypothetical protein